MVREANGPVVARRKILAGLAASVGLSATGGRVAARDRSTSGVSSKWDLVIDGAPDDEIMAVAGTADTGYLLAGETLDEGFYPLLVRVGDDGARKWLQVLDEPGAVHDVAVASGDGFVVCGARTRDDEQYPWLAKCRTDGTIAWEWSGDDPGLAKALERDGDDLVAMGRTGSLYDATGWLARVDDRGGTVDLFGETSTAATFVTDDAGFTLVGTRYDEESEVEHLQLTRLDDGGTERWRRTYETETDDRARSAVAIGRGTTVVGRRIDESTDGLVTSLTDDGDQRWGRTYSANGRVSIADVARAGEGYVVTGNQAAKSWVAHVDGEGAVLSEATYVNDVTDYIASGSAVVHAGDGSYFLVEHLTHPMATDDEDMYDTRVRKLAFESVPDLETATATGAPSVTDEGTAGETDGRSTTSDGGGERDENPGTETTRTDAGSWLPVVGAGGALAALGAAYARIQFGGDR